MLQQRKCIHMTEKMLFEADKMLILLVIYMDLMDRSSCFEHWNSITWNSMAAIQVTWVFNVIWCAILSLAHRNQTKIKYCSYLKDFGKILWILNEEKIQKKEHISCRSFHYAFAFFYLGNNFFQGSFDFHLHSTVFHMNFYAIIHTVLWKHLSQFIPEKCL